jgi:hypothetical protein
VCAHLLVKYSNQKHCILKVSLFRLKNKTTKKKNTHTPLENVHLMDLLVPEHPNSSGEDRSSTKK